MKLLFDQNLSSSLVIHLEHLFPGSLHVRDVGLRGADDRAVWEYAKQHGFAVVTKDADFHEMSAARGAPPKVVWIRLGNCPTAEVVRLLNTGYWRLMEFDARPDATSLSLGLNANGTRT